MASDEFHGVNLADALSAAARLASDQRRVYDRGLARHEPAAKPRENCLPAAVGFFYDPAAIPLPADPPAQRPALVPPMPLPTVTTTRRPVGRGAVNDVAVLARAIPLFPVDREMRLAVVADARAAAPRRIGWAACFLKAYAMVAREQPLLRSWLVRGLRSRLATASQSVATLAINRPDEHGADRLFFARLASPDMLPLTAVQAFVDRHATAPVDELFRRQLELEMVPGWLRRTILRWNMSSASPKRPGRIGTFSMSSLAGFSAGNHFHPTLCTTSLCQGPLDDAGRCRVTLIADHRVLDGATVAKGLQRLEEVLGREIAAELRTLPAAAAPPANPPALPAAAA